MSPELSLALLVSVIALLASVAAVSRRGSAPRTPPAIEELARHLHRVGADVARLTQGQEHLRLELRQGREDSLRDLADMAQGLQGRMASAQRDLAEVRALEQARTRQLDRATDSLRRLETIVAGSASRGAAGESILARALSQLPPDLLETNAAFEGRVAEYALRLPGGRLLPIDSKWTSAASLERLETTDDTVERRRLHDQVARDVRTRIREMAKYLDPERTLSLGMLAVPDAVHALTPETHAEGWRDGVLVVPYSLALPFVLVLYRLAVRLGAAPESDELRSRLAGLAESLRRMDETVEGRVSRGLVQIANARDDLRAEVAGARRSAERLAGAGEADRAVAGIRFDPSSGRG
ncbi:MAG: DNA recombination protein RmuC [Acidobacteria bacterium]|jgi:DNA recombination protein RmuC|nr:DNA recombination protein RmuC [Acidobacteriota bacterium]